MKHEQAPCRRGHQRTGAGDHPLQADPAPGSSGGGPPPVACLSMNQQWGPEGCAGWGSFDAVTNALRQPRQGSITACRCDGPRLAHRLGRALRIGHPHCPAENPGRAGRVHDLAPDRRAIHPILAGQLDRGDATRIRGADSVYFLRRQRCWSPSPRLHRCPDQRVIGLGAVVRVPWNPALPRMN